LDWSTATTDPYLLQSISAPSCKSCKSSIDVLSRLRAEGGYVQGGRYRIDTVESLSGKGDVKADYVIKFEITQAPVVVVRPTATNTAAAKAQKVVSYVYVSWVADHWLIIEREGVR